MLSTFGILDIPALSKLTWEIYSQCSSVAKDAPDGFRNLTNDLESLHGALKTINDDVSSNLSFFERMDEDRKFMLERCISASFETLHRLKDTLMRYRELGIEEGKAFWQRIKWITQRAQIENIRSKIMVHTCTLNLYMSSIGNSSLAHIEKTMLQAMEEDEQALLALEIPSDRDSDIIVSPLSLKSLMPSPDELMNEPLPPPRRRPRASSFNRFSRSSSQPRHKSSSSDSFASGSEVSFCGSSPISPLSATTSRLLSQSLMGKLGPPRGPKPYEGSIDGRVPDGTFWDDGSDIHEKQSIGRASHSSSTEFKHANVIEAITTAMQQLRTARQEEQLARPIRYQPQDKIHKPDPDTVKIFEASVSEELQVRRFITRDWLRIATWWLLKARATLANCNRHHFTNARGGSSPSSDSRLTSYQAYVDLLKASYILYDIVLKDESAPALSTDENRKSIADISEGINDELSQFSTIDIPEPLILQSQSLELWEPVQPEESSDSGSELSPGLENARWIAVSQDDAGSETEKVLYRTFVNAGIGGKKFRMRTKGAPYLLLLSTREGESEPKIILCNQSGTLCLQRDFTPADLQPLINLSNEVMTGFPGTRVTEPLSFKFGSTSVSISFQFDGDIGHFINIPKTYFDAVWQREPMDSKDFTESVIFQSSVEMFEQLKTPNMKSLNPPLTVKSCDVRILERSFSEAWRSIRRLVISPSAAEKMPRCLEFFMPLSRVQLSREDVSRQVLLKWSDTCQERSNKTDGNYNTLHSYVYDDSAPNLGIGLHFRTQQGAEDFEKAVLEMNLRPDFAWSQPSSSGCIYDVVDTGTEHKQYKAVALFQNRASWRYSDVYYIYRDADYAYEHSTLRIRFPRVYYADYLSTHVSQLYHAEFPVGFSHCEKKSYETVIEFNDESVSRSFMSALSPLYELLYSRRIQSLSSKSKIPFGPKTSGKGGAEIQLWGRGNSFQLAARWDDSIPDKWFTMALEPDSFDKTNEGMRVSFPRLSYSRGTSLDMMNIMARSPKTTKLSAREGAISILFQAVQDREDFLAVLQGKPLSSFI